MGDIEKFSICFMSLTNEANELKKFFKLNVPKGIPDQVKMILEKAFRVSDYHSFNESVASNNNWNMFSELFELWQDFALSKNFDVVNNYNAQLCVIIRIFLLALIKAVGYSYSDL